MQKLVIKIRKGKHHTAKSIMTGLCHAQQHIAEALVRSLAAPQDTLLLLHAVEIREMLRDIASKPQQQYTIKLTVVQAEAYRQMWGRLDLKYEAYGAVQVQDLLNEINRELDRPLQVPRIEAANVDSFDPNHLGTL